MSATAPAALPDDQRLLLDGLMAKLDGVAGPPALLRLMAEVLRTLLRRQGDAEFLITIQDAFTTGIAGLSWDEQKALAREVVRVVIDKRPEIARAWQAMHAAGTPPPVHRRAADQEIKPPAVPAPEPDSVEARLGEYVADIVLRRLALLRVAPPSLPSIAYCHTQPFFLFAPAFPDILRGFVVGALLEHCRLGLDRRVYRHAEPAILADSEAWKAFMADKRDTIWKILISSLSKLAAAHKTAEAKLLAAAVGETGLPEYKMVEMPVSQPRLYSILGVRFTLGQETSIKRVRVKVAPSYELEPLEQDALDLIAKLHHAASHAGLDLPASVDFQFLRTLLEFNVRLFMQSRDELMGLAGHAETSQQFLIERFKAVDEALSHTLADILAMMLFTQHGDARFGFPEFYAICIGAARDKSAVSLKRPFVTHEIGRRPRELAFQLREALRRRLHVDVVLAAVDMLIQCWQVMGRKRFNGELDAGLAVIGGFPMAFADDSEEPTFIAIGQMVREVLTSETPERSACLMQIGQAYDRIGRTLPALA
ncbi:MAG: hypothetical protein Q7R40_13320 [Phaeospirillum sp.]|nr:hypothetical protein [Phaeospirillum sp.]